MKPNPNPFDGPVLPLKPGGPHYPGPFRPLPKWPKPDMEPIDPFRPDDYFGF